MPKSRPSSRQAKGREIEEAEIDAEQEALRAAAKAELEAKRNSYTGNPEDDAFCTELVRIWKLPVSEQRVAIAALCSLQVEPLHFGPLNIKLDLVVGHLEFAKTVGFSLKQTLEFYKLMRRVHSELENVESTVESVYSQFKAGLINQKGGRGEYESMFTLDNILQIRNYVMNGIFGHFGLYKAIYCAGQFREGIQTNEVNVKLMTSLQDEESQRLADATPVEVIQRRERERERRREEERLARVRAEEEEARKREEARQEEERKREEEERRRAATPIRQVREEEGEYIKGNLEVFSKDIEQEMAIKMEGLEQKMKEIQLVSGQTKK